MERQLFLIAAKAPEPGQVKTRLGTRIGMERAAHLYAAFLRDLATRFTAAGAGAFDLGWAYTPASADFGALLARIRCVPQPSRVRYVPQEGDGWDVRQANLLRWGYEQGYRRVVLVGSDSPQLPVATIDTAFQALREHDVAIGRTHDGGYYLIGMRGFHDVLTGVPMSTISAAEALIARAREQGLSLVELPETFDIDEEGDLAHLRGICTGDDINTPATCAALRHLGLADAADG